MTTLSKAIEMLYKNDFSGDIIAHYNDGSVINVWNMSRQNAYMQSEVDDIEYSDDGNAHIYITFSYRDMWEY